MNPDFVVKDTDVKEEIGKSLFRHISHHISCRPYSEYRHNINLRPVFATMKSNVASIRGVTVNLPSIGRWYLYYVDNTVLMDVKLPNSSEWVCLSDRIVKQRRVAGFCSQHKMDIRVVVGTTSLCIPRKFVFVMKNPTENSFLFAINQEAMRKLSLSNRESLDDIWISFYYHHIDADFNISNYSTSVSDEISTFVTAANKVNSIALLNGEVVVSNISESDVEANSYAEIVRDSTLVGYVDVDLSNTYINKDGKSRILVHIPKELNQNNDILNHRVCDFVVIPEGSKTGRYITRQNTEDKFFTLTHNDFGIDTSLIDYYTDLLHANCKLRVYVRNHKKVGLVLSRDSKYIACLYRLDDATICKNLLGHTSMTMWSATELEHNSPYSDIVDKYLEHTYEDNFDTWVNCLGYPTAIDVACKRVFHMLATPDLLHKFYIALPAYYLGKKVTAHVFLNGKLLDPDHVRCETDLQFLKIYIDPSYRFSDDFTNNHPVSLDQYLEAQFYGKKPYFTVEIFENPEYRAGAYVLDTNESVTIYVDQDYVIYRSVDFNDKNKLPDDYIYNRFPFQTSYRELMTGETMRMVHVEDVEGTILKKITITNTSTKHKFIVASKNAYAKLYGVELQLKEMNYDIFCSHALSVKARPWPEYDEASATILPESPKRIRIPYLNTNQELLVYLNRRELTQGLDYKVYQAKTLTKNLCGQFVISQNVDYLNVAANVFEVYAVTEKNALCISGFLTEGRSAFESYYSLFPNSGLLITDGFIYNHAPSTVVGEYSSNLHTWCDACHNCNTYKEIRKGASTKIRAMMPYQFSEFTDERKLATDIENMKLVTNYMESVEHDLEAPAIIERSHHIYSTFIQTVIELVCRDMLIYNVNWSDQEIRDALSPYESMLKYDIGMSEENIEVTDPNMFIQPPVSGLDYRFVDVLPTYRIEPLIPDLTIYDKYPLLIIKGSEIDSINGNYICDNPDPTGPITFGVNEHTTKVWKNEKGSYIIHQILPDDGRYWIIHDNEGREHYRGKDTVGVGDVWRLKWEAINCNNPITVTPVRIAINTQGEFLARRVSFTLRANDRTFLTRVAKLYLNKDLVLDGVNIT